MYTLYFFSFSMIVYYIYQRVVKFFSSKISDFKDLDVTMIQELDFVDVVYEDDTRNIHENVNSFDFLLTIEKPIKYVAVHYFTDELHYVLFNRGGIYDLSTMEFPFYDNFTKLPLYREISSATLIIDNSSYDITNIIKRYAGPKLNYHGDISRINFEDIIDYSLEFPELKHSVGSVKIVDNFDQSHLFDYPGEFRWNENILHN